MRNIFFILTILLAILSSAAENRTVTEDRIWEYYSFNEVTYESVISKARFKGTVQLSGRTYHKFMVMEETCWIADTVGNGYKRKPVTTKPEKLIALMKEEDGKIYVLTEKIDESYAKVVTDLSRAEKPEDLLLYDFNATKGDTLDIGMYTDNGRSHSGSLLDSTKLYYRRVPVIDTGIVTIGNRECRTIKYRTKYDLSKTAIEGIGSTTDILFRPEYLNRRKEGYYVRYEESLSAVYNGKGELLYGTPKKLPQEYGDRPKLIREDRVWEYLDISGSKPKLYQMKFDGTEGLDGRVYHKFVYTGKIIYQTDSISDKNENNSTVTSTRESYDLPDTYYLLREENGRVYINTKNMKNFSNAKELPECLVYDFNINYERTNTVLCDWNSYCYYDIDITNTSNIEIEGETCKVQLIHVPDQFNAYSFDNMAIEGIGFTVGRFFAIEGPDHCGYHPATNFLNRVYDGNGKIIYRGFDKTLGVANTICGITDLRITYTQGNVTAKSEGSLSMTLYTLQGTKAKEVRGEGEVSVSTSGLVPGLYVARATDADGRTETKKILVR